MEIVVHLEITTRNAPAYTKDLHAKTMSCNNEVLKWEAWEMERSANIHGTYAADK